MENLRSFFRSLRPDRMAIKRTYKWKNGIYPDLDNPKDYTEKVLWLMLNRFTPLHTRCADKIAVKEYIKNLVGEDILIPTLMTTERVEDINPDKIRQTQFIVKANHDSGSAVICFDRDNFDWKEAREELETHLKTNYYNHRRERQYKNIKPALLVEELLLDERGLLPTDTRIMCFNGKPKFLSVSVWEKKSTDRKNSMKSIYLDTDWNPMDIGSGNHLPPLHTPPDRPKNLGQILDFARILSEPFEFCRVDLYNVSGKVYFAELTFTPFAGHQRFSPSEFERRAGDWINLS